MTRTPVPHRLTNALWTLAVPLVLAGTTVALVLSWRDRLPDPVAVHWGPDGVDGDGGLTELVLPLAIAVPVLAVGMWALGHFLGRAGLTRRLAAASAVWTGAYVSGVTLTTAAVQLDRADASQAGSLGVGMTVSLVAACALALLAGRLTPVTGRNLRAQRSPPGRPGCRSARTSGRAGCVRRARAARG